MAVAFVLLVAFGIGRAQTDFHGVVNPYGKEVTIDSVLVVPPDTVFPTAGWMSDGTKVDTFDFPDLDQWPTELRVYGVVNGLFAGKVIVGPRGGKWYDFGVGPFVMFYDTAGIYAVEEPGTALEPRELLTVSPSVVTGQLTSGCCR